MYFWSVEVAEYTFAFVPLTFPGTFFCESADAAS